jgi:hypothetical protein
MRRNVMGRVIGRSWRVAVSGPDRPRVEFSTLVTEPTSKPLRLGDRVSLRACRMGLIRALSTHPIEPNTPYAMYLGWYYTVECLGVHGKAAKKAGMTQIGQIAIEQASGLSYH